MYIRTSINLDNVIESDKATIIDFLNANRIDYEQRIEHGQLSSFSFRLREIKHCKEFFKLFKDG